jgi:hypothetical protein
VLTYLRVAVCAALVASTSVLHSQLAKTEATSTIRNVLPRSCRDVDTSTPAFVLLWKPAVRPPGLNIGSSCLPVTHTDFLEIDPRSLETVPTESGTPQFCGVARYRGGLIRICTRG